MSRGFPSMTALLGLLAVAGYQNRDKIAEILGGSGTALPERSAKAVPGGLLDQLRNSLGGASAGSVLSGGLGELLDRFKQSGHGEVADLLGENRSKQTARAAPTRAGDRPRGVRHPIKTNGIDRGRTACEAVPRAPRRG